MGNLLTAVIHGILIRLPSYPLLILLWNYDFTPKREYSITLGEMVAGYSAAVLLEYRQNLSTRSEGIDGLY
jgi:hypothetical protein